MAKSKTVSKADLVGEVVSATKLPRKTVKETVDALLDTMMSEIASGNKVTLTGFGSNRNVERQPSGAIWRESARSGHRSRSRAPGDRRTICRVPSRARPWASFPGPGPGSTPALLCPSLPAPTSS